MRLLLADQPSTLVDRVAEKLLYVPMPAELKQEIQAAVTSIVIPALTSSGSNLALIDTLKERRAKVAMFLVVASPEYQVQR